MVSKLEKSQEVKYRFSQINGDFCNRKWDLNTYVYKMTAYKNKVEVHFIHKFYLNFDIMKRLNEEFPNSNLNVEADSDRLVLVIED